MPEATKGALRSVFAGIGRILSLTDKARGKSAGTPARPTAPQAPTPQAPVPQASAKAAAPETKTAETTAPKTTAAETPAAETGASAAAEPGAAVEPAVEAAEPQAAAAAEPETVSEPTAATETGAAELPLPNYDELTIASVRARLRNLSVADLRQLIEYEKAHAARGDFVAAFERRIAKVESGK